ncbi:50S ribosomal protein L11 methyltransferase [Bradyrhizobium sp. LHD-71]|uniref:50S ribosomal protein L11 methyltransferase n=1 Tax=Bradyrhizobium sp. LHD-71 TaxID=3072141 RepID=UPI00280E6DC5|nr:50S ribosomal protein L11 methyltransferase [Bradyrhizobium sp. LHD-71]MDQ8727827.1 50S ribosomal protein L11 methyltransferase [Bradyrhizobium sp. LHD-71]
MSSERSTRAILAMADEHNARRIADILSEAFDNGETAVATFENAGGGWDITIHFGEPPDETAVRHLVALASDDATAATMRFEAVEAKDWVKASLEGLQPVEAGRFIVHGSHDRHRVAGNRIGIEIEAALAFGTGHHGTTRGCLELLDDVLQVRQPRRVLDLGTGTGVLAIAAAKALRQRVLASDIDRRAAITARENARLNRAGNLIEAICAPGFGAPAFKRRGPFDLVLANILANPLKRLATPMRTHLDRTATVILSGLLPSQANGVVSAYRANGLILQRRIELEGWTSLLLKRG